MWATTVTLAAVEALLQHRPQRLGDGEDADRRLELVGGAEVEGVAGAGDLAVADVAEAAAVAEDEERADVGAVLAVGVRRRRRGRP